MKKDKGNVRDVLLEAYHTLQQPDATCAERLRAHAVVLRHGCKAVEPMAAQDLRDAAVADLCEAVAELVKIS